VFRLLIIEPFDDFRELLVEVCETTGLVEVRSFRALTEIETVEQWAPAAVLVASRTLRDHGPTVCGLRASLPSLRYVVGMTSEPFGTGDLGCDRVVIKPFQTEALLKDIEEHLRDHGA
jgi:hypothetical protein